MSKLRTKILSFKDTPDPKPVEIPEWNETIHVKVLSVKERIEFEQLVSKKPDDVIGIIVALTACDKDGSRIFELDDVEALHNKNASAIVRLSEVALKLNKLTNEEVQEAKKS